MTLPSIADLVAQSDLNALVQRYTSSPRVSGNQSLYHCPHPSHPDTHPSFSVTTSRNGKQFAKCFSQCGWQGDALEFIKWIENVNTAEGVRKLQELSNSPRPVNSERRGEPRRAKQIIARDSAPRSTGEQAEKFLAAYLRSRSWPRSVVETFGLEVVFDNSGKPRIRHPYLVPNERGEWIPGYWQDRGAKDNEPKWLSPRGSTPLLFNMRSLEAANLEAVVICEGAADTITAALALEGCWRIAVVGVPGVNAWQPSWAELFKGLRVVVAADNDNAGRTLEQTIAQSVKGSVAFFRPSCGDITDTAKAIGLPAIREALIDLLGTQPETQEQRLEPGIALLREAFPGGFLVGEVA